VASQGRADGVSFDSPLGPQPNPQTYTLDGVSIVATAFNGGVLFGKNLGVGEQGVGLTGDPSGQNEIFAIVGGAPQGYIQLDLLSLITAGFTNIEFAMNSVTGPDAWQVTACATAGTPGSGPCAANGSTLTGMTEGLLAVPGNLSAADPFLDFSANAGNVLLSEIAATPPSVPEPSSLGLLLVGMLALVAILKLKRRTAELA
jgi:hypothetical protein